MSTIQKTGIALTIFGVLLLFTFSFNTGIAITGILVALIGVYLISGKHIKEKLEYRRNLIGGKNWRIGGAVTCVIGFFITLWGVQVNPLVIILGCVVIGIGVVLFRSQSAGEKVQEHMDRQKAIETKCQPAVVYNPTEKSLSFVSIPLNIDEDGKTFDVVDYVIEYYSDYLGNAEPYLRKKIVQRIKNEILPLDLDGVRPVDKKSCIAYCRLIRDRLEEEHPGGCYIDFYQECTSVI